MSELPTRSDFEGLLEQTFEGLASSPEGEVTVPLRLAEVSGPSPHQFALLFVGPADMRLDQGTMRLHHPEIGHADLFLVPVGAGDDGIHYESVFNLLPPEEPTP